LDMDLLLKKAQLGDDKAFEEIVEQFQKKIFSYCYYVLRNTHEAEDITQEVFLKVYKNIQRCSDGNAFNPWIYKIASNQCRTVLKRKTKLQRLLKAFTSKSAQMSSEQAYFEKTVSNIEWFQTLKVIEKQILILRIINDQTFEAISKILDIKPASLRKRYERIKKKVEKYRDSEGSDLYQQLRFRIREEN